MNPLSIKSARQRILDAAHDLFYRQGVRATGVDEIIATAEVTKVTFYRHFPSKQGLVRAFLEDRHQRWIAWFKEALERNGGDAKALVPALAEWFASDDYRGCAFINTVAAQQPFIARDIPSEASLLPNLSLLGTTRSTRSRTWGTTSAGDACLLEIAKAVSKLYYP